MQGGVPGGGAPLCIWAHAAGASHEEVLRDYPYLEAEDLEAALKYAARRLNHPTIAA